MGNIKKVLLMIALFVICLLSFSFTSVNCKCVSEIGEVQVIEQCDLPKELNLKNSKDYTTHSFFKQATAWEDGSFAICTLGNTTDGVTKNTDLKFIDIYNTSGEFVEEISFETQSDIAIARTKNSINVFLYSEIINYNLETGQVSYYTTPEFEAYYSGYVEQLRKECFTVGEWTYSYEKCFEGYTKLIRDNGKNKQVLLEMQDTDDGFPIMSILFSITLFCVCVGAFVLRKRTRKVRHTDY